MRLTLTLSLLMSAAPLGGCGDNAILQLRDHPIELTEEPWLPPIEGDPALEIGVMTDQLFRALAPGDELAIRGRGTQSSAATPISLRAVGVATRGEVTATLVCHDDKVANIRARMRMNPVPEGFLETHQMMVVFTEEWQLDERYEALFGDEAVLSVQFRDDDGRTAKASTTVVLVSY